MLARLLNVLLRLGMAYFLAETGLKSKDPRFAGKAIPVRNLVIVSSLSLLFPWLHFFKKRWQSYPFGLDNLYLSVYFLDMAGNSFDLYDRYFYFDLLPHAHGTGAMAFVLKRLLRLPTLSAVGLTNMLHLLLEAQEYYTDVLLGTHNVRGVSDTVNDLLAGLAGTIVYGALSDVMDCRSSPKLPKPTKN